jgi:hypothetical protein
VDGAGLGDVFSFELWKFKDLVVDVEVVESGENPASYENDS